MTSWDVNLAKFESAGVGAEKRRDRPRGPSGIGDEDGNSGDQISRGMFKSSVVTSPDHLLSGRPGSDRKSNDACPRYEPQRGARNFHVSTVRIIDYPVVPGGLSRV